MPTIWLDAAFVLVLAVVVPWIGVYQFRALSEGLDRGDENARLRLYRTLLTQEVLLAVVAVTLWVAADRALGGLGPDTSGSGLWAWIGWAAAILFAAFMAAQALLMGRDARGQDLARARGQLEDLKTVLPHSAAEARRFGVLSVAAGIGEEIVYRGFVLAWLAALLTAAGLGATPALWAAVVGSSALFGLAHAYQGAGGVLRTGLTGFALALLAVATGGLLAPMIVHTALDLSTGTVARKALGGTTPTAARAQERKRARGAS